MSVPVRLCSVEGCESKHLAKGYCAKHYWRLKKNGSLEPTIIRGDHLARFWSHVQKTPTCWLWQGYCIADGYGSMSVGPKPTAAHRYSFELHKGPVPDGLFVCHSCDVRNCVNPDHLWLGTLSDNNRDMALKGRAASGSVNANSKLTERDVITIRLLMSEGLSNGAIGKRYGVSKSTIWSIKRGITWGHLK